MPTEKLSKSYSLAVRGHADTGFNREPPPAGYSSRTTGRTILHNMRGKAFVSGYAKPVWDTTPRWLVSSIATG